MRFTIFLSLFLAFAVICLAVPTFASTFYNDHIFPELPSGIEQYGTRFVIGYLDGELMLVATSANIGAYSSGSVIQTSKSYQHLWTVQNDSWVYLRKSSSDNDGRIIVSEALWSNSDIYYFNSDSGSSSGLSSRLLLGSSEPVRLCDGSNCPSTDKNKDNFCDDCGDRFLVERDYTFTVSDFMSHVRQIFAAAISWVSKVGAAIVDQPLLLAFCALPLCGIGIGVFRRLRNAN